MNETNKRKDRQNKQKEMENSHKEMENDHKDMQNNHKDRKKKLCYVCVQASVVYNLSMAVGYLK